MKLRKKKVSALLAGSLLMNLISSSGINAMAIDANQAASGNLDELNQAIVDCSLIKHYISGDMGFTEHTSESFKKRLDYDGNGVINIYDEMKAKAIIFEYAEKQNENTTSTSVSSAATTPVTTTTAPTTTVSTAPLTFTNPTSLKKGDKIYYKGNIHGSSTGSGKSIPVENFYEITDIQSGTNPYTVQIGNLGWVAYNDVAGKTWNVNVAVTSFTTSAVTSATSVTNPSEIKKGDKVYYKGYAYSTVTGEGNKVSVDGTFEISDIWKDASLPYTVQLKNIGWVAYKDITGKPQPQTTTATTSATTKVTSSTTAAAIKVGDKINYSGKVYQSATGSGEAKTLPAGTYEISAIDSNTSHPYRVQLKGMGWIAYNDAVGKQAAVTTTVTAKTTTASATTAATTTAATTAGAIKVGDKINYSGKVYMSATGSGEAKTLPAGTYEISAIDSNTSHPYRVQLKGMGWIAYNDAVGKQAAVTTTVTTKITTASATTAATTTAATAAGAIKVGDKINYSGKVYMSATGSGDAKTLPAGTYEISAIDSNTSHPYRVQLKGMGWIAYNDAVGKQAAVTTTTAATTAVTTVSSSAATSISNPSVLKEGDKVYYKGDIHETASGTGNTVKNISGTFKIVKIISDGSVPYGVQFEKYGWVAYNDVAGKSSSQTQAAVTTAQTTSQTSASSEAADFNNSKIKLKNSASGKYLSADSTADKSNVFQLSADSSKNQVLTVKKYYSTDSVRLYFNDKQVIDIVKNEIDDESKKISAGCNIEVYNDCDDNAQIFKIIKVSDNAYKIVSSKNPSVCLTASGTGDGSNSAVTQTSSGNIYLSDYSGKSEQLWIIEKV